VTHQQLRAASHPYFQAVNQIFAEKGFDKHAEEVCAKFYATKMGRPGLAPGIYFRLLLLGYFEGIDSERGIAWRAADSLSLRDFGPSGEQAHARPLDNFEGAKAHRSRGAPIGLHVGPRCLRRRWVVIKGQDDRGRPDAFGSERRDEVHRSARRRPQLPGISN
jgi:hypothetical protein